MIVIGAIFFGIATATESAALGIVLALAITAWRRRLTLTMLREVREATCARRQWSWRSSRGASSSIS
jgi:C4-dicarboxylate transporter, DctM subunit